MFHVDPNWTPLILFIPSERKQKFLSELLPFNCSKIPLLLFTCPVCSLSFLKRSEVCVLTLLLQWCRATLTRGKHERQRCSLIQELCGNLQLIIMTVLPQFCASVIPDLYFGVRHSVWEGDKSSFFSHVLSYRLCTLKSKWSQSKDVVLKNPHCSQPQWQWEILGAWLHCCTSGVMKRIWFSYNGNCLDATSRFPEGK